MLKLTFVLAAAAAVSASMAASARAQLTNADFEASPFDTGWTNGSVASGPAAVQGGGLVAGSTQSAFLTATPTGQRALLQSLDSPVGPTWTFEALFASDGTAGRMFQTALQHEPDAGLQHGQINLIVTSGGVQVYETGTTGGASNGFRTIISASVLGSDDANDNHSFNDPGDTRNVYKLTVSGDYGSATPSYDVSLIDFATGAPLGTANDVAFWQYAVPATGSQLWQTEFFSNAGPANSTFAVDNVVVPEPAALGLLAAVALGVRRRRRRPA